MYRTISRLLMTLTLAALAGIGDATADETMTPLERVASTPKGELKSPIRTSPASPSKAISYSASIFA
jgi:hypothetical protein